MLSWWSRAQVFLALLKLRASFYECAHRTAMSCVRDFHTIPSRAVLFPWKPWKKHWALLGLHSVFHPCLAACWLLTLPLAALSDRYLPVPEFRPTLARKAFHPSFRAARLNPVCVDPSKCVYTVLLKAAVPSASAQGCLDFSGLCIHP